MITTDRISAFDSTLPDGIPGKGRVLTQLSSFWFDYTSRLLPNHLISSDMSDLPENLIGYRSLLAGRSMIVRKARRLDIECVVRGYLAGSGCVGTSAQEMAAYQPSASRMMVTVLGVPSRGRYKRRRMRPILARVRNLPATAAPPCSPTWG